jgi:hypothetical protein
VQLEKMDLQELKVILDQQDLKELDLLQYL